MRVLIEAGALRLAKGEQRLVAWHQAALRAEGRLQFGQVDGAEVRRRGKVLLEVARAVHEAGAIDAVAEAVHVEDLVGRRLACTEEQHAMFLRHARRRGRAHRRARCAAALAGLLAGLLAATDGRHGDPPANRLARRLAVAVEGEGARP